MCNHHKPTDSIPHGSALEHGEAHERDHHFRSRRSFLRNLGLFSGGAMLLGNTPVAALANNPLAWGLANANTNRALVLIRFKGGNDGLNTIIPVFDYGTYQAARPSIHIPQSELLNLNGAFAMPNYMSGLSDMWQDGQMKVVNSVGYADQNLSHFRSTDIWATGSDSEVMDTSGWLGRLLEGQFPDFITDPPEAPPAIQIGGSGTYVFDDSMGNNMSVQVEDPEALYEIAQNGELYDPLSVPECYYGEQIAYLRTVANNTFRYAEVISQAYNSAENSNDYPNNLGRQLALVARLIKGGLDTKLYMVTLDGFDTHAGQANQHANLMNNLAESVKAFYEDLAAANRSEDVLCMSFSEFGRRIEQNASNGTDHGAASCMLLFGPALNGNGILGQNPDMHDVDDAGNLKFGTDFRQIYATVLEKWLCVDHSTVDEVMGQYFERMGGLGISCAPTPVFDLPAARIRHWAAPESREETAIYYVLPHGAEVQVEVFNMFGQPVGKLFRGWQPAGQHRQAFRASAVRLAAGYYVYRITVQGQAYSGKIAFAR
ncbi:DUF1501 domain-containing protein [Phaeodactylibacter luteus]|uniref:DUF1501 domain-containing protein n=1 Tax=Phaeodactylibacter luteus TaxID=1564516 RepID=A0A5C6RLC6_9BACT|nr:DUF1501 domain-containing protein [Phaeodactylibacter luteus]TXB63201.1 DUF1501 domain-containing protein [Phaeodactylibacter luteus]